jgi:branched-chain amino acid transport system ATP-binding protein
METTTGESPGLTAAERPVLEIDAVSLAFGGVKALSGVSFAVQPGTITSVIGPNGAGKTSLFNTISGFYRPSEGAIRFQGQDITRVPAPKRAGMGLARSFQNIALFRGMTVLDNIKLGRHAHLRTNVFDALAYFGRARREEMALRADVETRIIDFLEIQAFRKTPVGQLPYGLQKRVDLGRALAMEPQVLLLDEPMAGMNLEEKQDMSRFILDVNDEFGTTIVLIEHDMGVVMDISDRVVVLDYGKKIGDGTPEEVRNNEEVISAYLGTSH